MFVACILSLPLQVGGLGLTLTAANGVVIVEPYPGTCPLP
jgi:SNF2 family DNA or RNA helicase